MSASMNALLCPRTLAILGASEKPGSAGRAMIRAAQSDGFAGAIYPVNPRYDSICGLPCFPDISSLPQVPDHVVVGLSNDRLLDSFDALADAGVRAATVFASGVSEDPELLDQLQQKAEAAGILVCGPNCMGLLRPETGLRITVFEAEESTRRGGIVWLAQSGSAFSALTFNQARLGFKLAVSTGAEMNVDVSDHMHWALDQEDTSVIGLFLEGVRRPARFIAALERAQDRRVPVVILKVGRTQRSAAMAASHTGALAGNDGAHQAVCRKYNVIQVDDLDEATAVLSLLDSGKRFYPGGLATMHDSGGERELLVDLAEEIGVELAHICEDTKAAIQPHLDTGLVAENPLDAWGTAHDFEARYRACAEALLRDTKVSALGFFSDPRDAHAYHAGLVNATTTAAQHSDKPVFIASNTLLTNDRDLYTTSLALGVPLIKGTRNALKAISRINAHARFYPDHTTPATDIDPPHSLSGRLDEEAGLALLAQVGIGIPGLQPVTSEPELRMAANTLNSPFVLKTAEGHAHKSDMGGVVTRLPDLAELQRAYENMSHRLGPRALVMEMAPEGIEIGIGAFIDSAFGPVVAVSAGGVAIEVFRDVQFALAPIGPETVGQMVKALTLSPLLRPHRGQPAADLDSLCRAIARFSQLVWALRDRLQEADVNPIIVSDKGAVAVDALFVFKEP